MIFKNLAFLLHFGSQCLIASYTRDWKCHEEPEKHIDFIYKNKKIARYVYEKMDPNDRERTFKPFHYIYQSDGKNFLTKGPGGKFTHHRGIYFGFSKCSVLDSDGARINVDTWHCKRGYQLHEKTIHQNVGNKKATHTVEISWRVEDGTIFATEQRTLSFSILLDDSIQVDFNSKLSTTQEEVRLDGDPHHAGLQFRAANEVAGEIKKEIYYIRPSEGKDKKGETKNWPKNKDMTNILWKAQSIVVNQNRYTTLYMDHPGNPKLSYYSERDYGRFGSFFKTSISPGKPLSIKYRLNIKKLGAFTRGMSINEQSIHRN